MSTTLTRARNAGAPPPPEVDDRADDPATDEPRRLQRITTDGVVTMVGSALSSLAVVWVVNGHLLPWTGAVGFLVCWYAVFVGLVAGATALGERRPVVVDRVVTALVFGAAGLVGLVLATTVLYTFWRGLSALVHANFYRTDMAGVGPNAPLDRGGIVHAMVGSAIEVAIATAIALPLGVGTAIFMSEVGGRLARWVRVVVEAMTAMPDILAGLFIYTVLIITLGFSRTGFCAAMALTVMMIPTVARAAEVSLRVVPGGLREAGMALGASQWQTVRMVVLPTARPGLATALILGVARIVGETAPVLITSGASTFTNTDPLHDPMNSLPLFIYTSVRSYQPLAEQRGFGAASVLLFLVVVLFVVTRLLARTKGMPR